VDLKGKTLTLTFGKIGTKGQSKLKDFATPEKAKTEMEKLIKEKTRKGYVEVGGKAVKAAKPLAKPAIKPAIKPAAKPTKPAAKPTKPAAKPAKPAAGKKTNAGSLGEGVSKAEKKAKAEEVILLFADGQWNLAHDILEAAKKEVWLFEQLLEGCKIENGEAIPSNTIDKLFKIGDRNNPVLAMLNIIYCIPDKAKILKLFNFEKLKKDLDLEGLKSLSDGAAKALSKYKGKLNLGRLESLPDSPGHIALIRKLVNLNEILDLQYLTSLSDAAAEVLSNHEGELYLRGLKSLSDTAAEALSNHQGGLLCLDGLTSLSDAAAEAFGKHVGVLLLDGLKSLSDAAVEALRYHEGALVLDDLISLSDAAYEALSERWGRWGR
jgi:predicted DNA-binding WGR domain protein